MILAHINLGNVGELTIAEQKEALRQIVAEGAEVICAVESGVYSLEGYESYGREEIIFWKKGIRTKGYGYRLCSLTKTGEGPIRLRRTRYVNFPLANIGMLQAWTFHMAPRRMPKLRVIYARRLRRFLRNSPYLWAVGGDWNWFIVEDPCDLHRDLNAIWKGKRIDGWAIDPNLRKFIKDVWFRLDPEREDKHQATFWEITA